jgi:tRNA modification GTPase
LLILIHSEDVDRGILSSKAVAGKLSELVVDMGKQIDELRVFIEGSIDFSDEDYDFVVEGNVMSRLLNIKNDLISLIDSSLVSSKKLTQNRVLFFGPPNTGKSSLFNRMLGFERALVSNTPGTTRDLIDSEVFYNSVNMELVDSAGVRSTDNLVESEGVVLSGNEVEECDLVLLILDHHTEDLLKEFKLKIKHKDFLSIFNKSDELKPREQYNCVVSAKNGHGVAALKDLIIERLGKNKDLGKTYLIRERHLALFESALSAIDSSIERISKNINFDVAAEDLRTARSSFDEFLGVKYPDHLLGDIFRDFCIGK